MVILIEQAKKSLKDIYDLVFNITLIVLYNKRKTPKLWNRKMTDAIMLFNSLTNLINSYRAV